MDHPYESEAIAFLVVAISWVFMMLGAAKNRRWIGWLLIVLTMGHGLYLLLDCIQLPYARAAEIGFGMVYLSGSLAFWISALRHSTHADNDDDIETTNRWDEASKG